MGGEENSASKSAKPTLFQPALPLELEEEINVVVRPERNLEKWPIWEPSNSRHQMQERMLQREIRLPDGNIAVARVKVGYTNNGALTTEDQKTCYALFRIWDELGKPAGRIYFSRQQLARVLKKSWGSKTNKALTESLMRLRFTPFVWERSYFDSARQETVERIDTFNIVSELHLIRRVRGETTLAEGSYFEFNERILANLMAGFTRPVYLDTILKFQSEIAQILYTHLDLVMADKTHYERRTKELFEQLGIDGTTYRYPSKRVQALEPALRELENVPVPTGTLSVVLERTADKLDYKIVARKTRQSGARRKGVPEEGVALAAMPAVALELFPPVVTQVVNAPPAPRKPAGKSRVKAAQSPVEASEGPETISKPLKAETGARKAQNDSAETGAAPSRRELVEQAREQARQFHNVFFQSGETSRPTPRELALAAEHVARLGVEKAQYLIQFARREAKKTGFEIQNYGGVAQYEARAVAEYEENERRRRDAFSERHREGHRQRHFPQYLEYLRTLLAQWERSPHPGFLRFLEEERQGRERLSEGKLAENSTVRRLARAYDAPDARLNRFRDFLRDQMERGERVEGALSFWEWDASLNPEPLAK